MAELWFFVRFKLNAGAPLYLKAVVLPTEIRKKSFVRHLCP